MSSNSFYFYLKNLEKKLTHDFIPPRSPDRNAYIEAFSLILETEVIQVQYFSNFEEVYLFLISRGYPSGGSIRELTISGEGGI